MTSLSLEQTNELKEIVLHYLQGEDISVVKVRLQVKCAEFNKSSESLYKLLYLDPNHYDPYLDAILSSLNIKAQKTSAVPGTYEKLLGKSKNLYELLIHLYHDGHRHVGHLLHLIEDTKPKTNWAMIFLIATFSSAGLGTLMYLIREKVENAGAWVIRTFPSLLKWLVKPSILLRFTPIIGIVYNSLGLIWSWYKTFANGTTTHAEKLYRLFFKTLASGFTIAAYAVSYVVAGAINYPIAILFVLGASVDVFQGLFNFRKSQIALQTLRIPTEGASWEVRAEYERAKNSHQHALKSVWVKIGAALLITFAVAVWNFFPPNLVLTLACMIFISFVGLAKKAILSNFSEHFAHDLQRKLRQMGTTIEPSLKFINNNTLIKLDKQQRLLDEKERELEQRKKALDEREEKLSSLSSAAHALRLLKKNEITTRVDGNSDDTAPEEETFHADGFTPPEEKQPANDETYQPNDHQSHGLQP